MPGISREVLKERERIFEAAIKNFNATGKTLKGHLRTLAAEIADKHPGFFADTRARSIDIIRNCLNHRLQKKGKKSRKSTETAIKYAMMTRTDKKKGSTNWRDYTKLAKEKRRLHKESSWTQTRANISIKTKKEWIVIQPLSDTHIGSYATDYDKFEEYTEFLKKNPYLYTCLIGDMTDHFVNFRNVAAMHGQVLSPQEQADVMESWIAEIEDKILFATWCNHSEMEEKVSGFNTIKRILERKSVYFNGIGHCTLMVNDIPYEIVATHKTRYFSSFNLTHGLLQLARKDVQGADVYIGGDKHEPSLTQAPVGGKITTFMQLGTLKTDDTFSKRYFSFYTNPEMPCFALNTKTKQIIPFIYLENALTFIKHTK